MFFLVIVDLWVLWIVLKNLCDLCLILIGIRLVSDWYRLISIGIDWYRLVR